MPEPVRPERAEVTELAQDSVTQFQSFASASGVPLQLQIDPRTPQAFADIRMLEAVLQNLLENARRHAPRGGVVIVCVAPGANGAETTVIDTGCSIAAEDLERTATL